MMAIASRKTSFTAGTLRYILLAGGLGFHAAPCLAQEQPAPAQQRQASAPDSDSTEPPRAAAPDASFENPDAGTAPVAPASDGKHEQRTPVIALPEPAAAPVKTAPASAAEQPLEEIIVTASKREESIRDIPVSIDAFTAADLESRGANGSQDALLFSPGVSVNAYYSPTLTQVQVRGTTTQTEATNQAAPTGAFLDDVTLGNPSLVGGNPNIDTFDLERVEVLKGPQGTLFGGAALAGALRSIPQAPKLSTFEGHGFASRMAVAESDDQSSDWGAAINVPLGDSFAVRAMTVRRAYPGAIDNLRDGIPDVNSYSVTQRRAMARWEPSEGWAVDAMFHTLKSSIREITHTDNPGTSQSFSNESGFSPSAADYKFARAAISKTLFDRIDAQLVVAQVRKLDIIDVQADRILVQTPLSDLVIGRDAKADTRTAELRFNSIGPIDSRFTLLDNWNWVTGLYHLESDQSVVSDYQLTLKATPDAPITPLSADIHARAIENAFYMDATRGIGDRWDLTLGARLFEQESDGRYVQSSNGIQLPSEDASSKDRGVLPKVALTWHVTDSLSLRGLAVKGFRFAGFNALIVNDGSAPLGYDSDSLWNYELGVRSDWFGGRFRADLTAFLIDWSKIQIAQTTADSEVYTVNAGRARNMGVETALTLKLPYRFILTTNAAYIDARITEDFDSSDGPVPAGSRLPGTPYLTGSVVLTSAHEIPIGTLTSSVTWTYQGGAESDLANSIHIPAYSLLGAGVTLTTNWWGQPALTLGGSNLTNKRGYTGAINLDTVTDYIPLQPRTVFVKLSVAW